MTDPIMQLRARAILRGRFLDCTPTFAAMQWRLILAMMTRRDAAQAVRP